MSTGDVVVLGMAMGIHMIEDISMGVPQGMVVTIPADLALRSRDLWRAISLKQVFRLHAGSHQAPLVVPPAQADPMPQLIEENRQLEAALLSQQAQNTAILEQLKAQADAIKALTTSLANAPRTVVVQQGGAPGAQAAVGEDAPTFIPSNIKPEAAEVRIETRREETTEADISTSRDRLRRLRQ